MKLEDLASGRRAVPLALIGGDKDLALQVQERLGAIGLLDPPADGMFGPASLWALGQFLRKAGHGNAAVLDQLLRCPRQDQEEGMPILGRGVARDAKLSHQTVVEQCGKFADRGIRPCGYATLDNEHVRMDAERDVASGCQPFPGRRHAGQRGRNRGMGAGIERHRPCGRFARTGEFGECRALVNRQRLGGGRRESHFLGDDVR